MASPPPLPNSKGDATPTSDTLGAVPCCHLSASAYVRSTDAAIASASATPVLLWHDARA